jgi:Carbohydrate esterase, sialic acid-specific acetylesterase
MKRIFVFLITAVLSFGLRAQQPSTEVSPPQAVVTPPSRQNFHIYLLMGQSNMVGRDTSKLASQVDDAQILAQNAANQWVVAREPMHAQVGSIAVGQGPGIPFAQEMLRTEPGITIGLVPCAVGGTALRRWVKGGDLYEACVARAKLVAQAGRIEGVLWHQGEADTTAQSDADSYATRLIQMFRDLRNDLKLPNLPIVVGQLGPFLDVEKYPYVETVRSAIQHMPADLPYVGYADSTGLVDKGDRLHFNADSQNVFGGRYAKAMRQATGK